MNKKLSKNFVVKLLNTLEVIEVGDSDSPYVLVKDNDEFRAVCKALEISNTDISSVSDGRIVDILALAAFTYGITEYEEGKGFCA